MEHSTKQVIIRENPSARQAHTNPNKKIIQIKKSVKKNRSVASGLSVIDFERGERAEGERAQKELSGRQYRAKRE